MKIKEAVINCFLKNTNTGEGLGYSAPPHADTSRPESPAEGMGNLALQRRQASDFTNDIASGARRFVRKASSNQSVDKLRSRFSDRPNLSETTEGRSEEQAALAYKKEVIKMLELGASYVHPAPGMTRFTPDTPAGIKAPLPIKPDDPTPVDMYLSRFKLGFKTTPTPIKTSSKLSPPRSDAALPSAASPNPAAALDNSQKPR
jgi:hypothetical protein